MLRDRKYTEEKKNKSLNRRKITVTAKKGIALLLSAVLFAGTVLTGCAIQSSRERKGEKVTVLKKRSQLRLTVKPVLWIPQDRLR